MKVQTNPGECDIEIFVRTSEPDKIIPRFIDMFNASESLKNGSYKHAYEPSVVKLNRKNAYKLTISGSYRRADGSGGPADFSDLYHSAQNRMADKYGSSMRIDKVELISRYPEDEIS